MIGTVDTIAPVANAQSGTIRVKVRLPNADGKLRSGVKCSLVMP
jgi:multidrug efflux pump subunit AcrA (membrane-fusion protein)